MTREKANCMQDTQKGKLDVFRLYWSLETTLVHAICLFEWPSSNNILLLAHGWEIRCVVKMVPPCCWSLVGQRLLPLQQLVMILTTTWLLLLPGAALPQPRRTDRSGLPVLKPRETAIYKELKTRCTQGIFFGHSFGGFFGNYSTMSQTITDIHGSSQIFQVSELVSF